MRSALLPLLVGCALALPAALAESLVWGQTFTRDLTQRQQTLLTEDFEGESKGDWSIWQTDQTPLEKNAFLGQFGAQAVTLALHQLPPHKLLHVKFDLYIIRSWDGSNSVFGPDIWQLSLVNGPTLLRTTFNNCRRVGSDQQAFPDNYPSPPHPCWTGAVAHESLGYSYQFKTRGTLPMDAVYRIEAVVPHQASVVGLQFAAFYNDKLIDNQSWGIDNLQVQISDEIAALSEEQFQQSWGQLANKDPVQASEALWRLVAAGDNATRYIVKALSIDDQQTQREIAEGTRLLQVLRKLDLKDREALSELVAEKLAAMGGRSISVLKEQFALHVSTDLAKTFQRAQAILARSQARQSEPADDLWRLRRAKRALSIIDTPQARRALWALSEPGKFDTNDEQYAETQLKCE